LPTSTSPSTPYTSPTISNSKQRPFKFTKKRLELTGKQIEVLDWIENLIVPALVEKYIEEQVLNKGARRG
jgi:hypothetical protein